MEKIEITEDQLNEAMRYLFLKGELKEIVKANSIIILLMPLIAVELWKILSGNKEVNADGEEEQQPGRHYQGPATIHKA